MLKSQVVGEDPLDTERIWENLYWATLQYGRRGAAIRAIGMIDIALWDLKGKVLNQPVHKLLGAHRDSVPVYGSGVNLNLTKEELVDQMTVHNAHFMLIYIHDAHEYLLIIGVWMASFGA